MKTQNRLRTSIITVLVINCFVLFGVASCSKRPLRPSTDSNPDPSPHLVLDGVWMNVDLETPGITRIEIDSDIHTLYVQAWGKCHPTDCYWGSETVDLTDQYDSTIVLSWEYSWVVRSQSISLVDDGRLQVNTHNHYIDDSGRPDSDRTDYFIKSRPLPDSPGHAVL